MGILASYISSQGLGAPCQGTFLTLIQFDPFVSSQIGITSPNVVAMYLWTFSFNVEAVGLYETSKFVKILSKLIQRSRAMGCSEHRVQYMGPVERAPRMFPPEFCSISKLLEDLRNITELELQGRSLSAFIQG